MELFKKAHDYLGVTINVRKDLQIQYRKSADQGLAFIGQIITISGVIAGFGFTAIDKINCKWLFVFGELFLFLNICVGLYFIKSGWFDGLKAIKKDIRKLSEIADKLKGGDESFVKEGIGELEIFAKDKRDPSAIFNLLPTLMIIFIAVASILILLSI